MTSIPDIVAAIGAPLLRLTVDGGGRPEVSDVCLAESGDHPAGQPGDLVLGAAVTTTDEALTLLADASTAESAAVVLRASIAADPRVTARAEELAMTVVAVQDDTSWVHLIWLLRGVLDRPGPAAAGAGAHGSGGPGDLFSLADAVAAILDAPVTIEDNRSRVLAYSSGQDRADTARVATIIGRRVPRDTVAHFRAIGVFRRLATTDEPFLVPADREGIRPRLVVPIRAGREWLGSIWAIVDGPVDDATMAELRPTASVLALHLLRQRAQADLARRQATDRLRSALLQYSPEQTAPELPSPGPWRAVALGTADDADGRLELWDAVCRRNGWARPQLADLEGVVYAVVDDTAHAGSWRWIRRLLDTLRHDDQAVWAAAGAPAATVAELPRSRAEARELLHLIRLGHTAGPVMEVEQAWDSLTVYRAATAIDVNPLGGPLHALIAHDTRHKTNYLATLAAWLRHPGQPQAAARELAVHVNTLRHRMRRMAQLAPLSLDDPRQRMALQLQIEAHSIRAGEGDPIRRPGRSPGAGGRGGHRPERS